MNVIINYINKAQNLLLRKTSFVSRINTDDRAVYLTFDDGPEDGIVEFVIKELEKYGYKATFFCRGDNAETHPELLKMLYNKGHSIGNHTYNHLHSYEVNANKYTDDVNKADELLNTKLFRPPHGSLTIRAWLKLHKKYRIFFWSLNSGDSDMQKYNFQQSIDNLKNNTTSGDIVLFHFCHRHEKETMQLLPIYLQWLHKQGYDCKAIK